MDLAVSEHCYVSLVCFLPLHAHAHAHTTVPTDRSLTQQTKAMCLSDCWVAMVKLLHLIDILLCFCPQPSLMQFTQSSLGCLHKSQYKQTQPKRYIWKTAAQNVTKFAAFSGCMVSWFPEDKSSLTTREFLSRATLRKKIVWTNISSSKTHRPNIS